MPNFDFVYIFASLICTIIVYSLPIIIFRYAILKHPIEKDTAVAITSVYAVLAFIGMYLLIHATSGRSASGGGLFLWSYVNYRMLVGGKDKRKATPHIPDSPIIASHGYKEETFAENVEVSSVAPITATMNSERKAKKQKKTYCKECGKLIDSSTGKCSGCGKQYFHLSKAVLIWVIVSIFCAGLVGLIVYQCFQVYSLESQLQSEISKSKSNEAEYEDTIASLRAYNLDLIFSQTEYENKANFLDEHIVFVVDDGTYTYHTYDCEHFKNSSSFWAYNLEAAESKGYTPCPYCSSKF